MAELEARGLIKLNEAVRAQNPGPGETPATATTLPIERIMPQDASGRRVVAQGWTGDMAEWVDMSRLTIGQAQAM